MDMRNFYRRNLPVLLVLGIILALAGAGAAKQAAALPAGSWGLSFQQEGQPPVGNTTADRLRQYDAAFLGDTAQILDALQKHHAPAAFFLVGNYIERNPDLVRRMAQEGHTVGNHTYHHWDMSKIGEMEQFRQELESLETLYRDTTGQELARFYRPPQGIYSEKNLEMAQQLGYHTVFWSLAYVAWLQDDQPTSEQAYAKLIPRIHNGAVVLLHSTSQTNAAILDSLLTRWEEMGYSFGEISELFPAG